MIAAIGVEGCHCTIWICFSMSILKHNAKVLLSTDGCKLLALAEDVARTKGSSNLFIVAHACVYFIAYILLIKLFAFKQTAATNLIPGSSMLF